MSLGYALQFAYHLWLLKCLYNIYETEYKQFKGNYRFQCCIVRPFKLTHFLFYFSRDSGKVFVTKFLVT